MGGRDSGSASGVIKVAFKAAMAFILIVNSRSPADGNGVAHRVDGARRTAGGYHRTGSRGKEATGSPEVGGDGLQPPIAH